MEKGWRPILHQQLPLPVHQLGRVFVPIASQFQKRGAAGDERGVYAELVGAGITAFFQFG